MPKATPKQIAWKHFAEMIRLRDSMAGYGMCISCNRRVDYPNSSGDFQCGHYYPRSTVYANLYFSTANSHGQCKNCNCFLEGNTAEYRKGLIRRYGEAYVAELEDIKSQGLMQKLYESDYKEMAAKYRKLNREMKKARGIK